MIGANDFLPTLTRADAILHTVLGYFNHFLPVAYFKDTVLPATNACLTDPMRWEEFLLFIGLILLMATTQGNARQYFWSSDNPEMFSGASFRLNAFMLRRRFENILRHLRFTAETPPSFRHPFHLVNELIKAFNAPYKRMLQSGMDKLP